MARISGRSLALASLFCLVPLLNFPRALLVDRTLFLRDISMVWAPQIEEVVDQVARGDFPSFDARRAFGQPLFADPRSEVLYPPAWIHWILPVERSYALFCAFHLVIGGLGAARLARRLVPGASFHAQAVAGFAYAAGGPMLSLVSHWHHLAAAAWMPWIVERADPGLDERTPWLQLSGLVALQVFAGSPDYTFATFVLCALRLVTRSEGSTRGRARVALALVMGVLLSAVQLLPSLAFARDAAREPFPVGWALSPLHPALTLETLVPIRVDSWPLRPEARSALFGQSQVWMFSHYLGLSVWALAFLGLIRAKRGDRVFLLGAVALGIILALGVTSSSAQVVIARLPIISGLRFPTKYLAISSLALSMLAAMGTAEALTFRIRNGVLAFTALCAASSVLLFAWSTEPAAPLEAGAVGRVLTSLVCASCVVFLRGASRLGLPLVVAIDLLVAHTLLNPTTPSNLFRDRPPLTTSIPRGARLYVSDYSMQVRSGPIRPAAGPTYGLREVPEGFTHPEALALAATWYLNPPTAGRFGYYGSFDLDVLDFYRAPLRRTIEAFAISRDPQFILENLRRGSVDYVVTMDDPSLWNSFPLVTQESRFFEAPIRVYAVPGSWPRVRYETPDGGLDPERPRVIEMRDGKIEVEGESALATRLVVAVSNDRGWRASVDGHEASTEDTPMGFISVPLPAGRHRTKLSYEPPMFKAGLAISLLALGAVLALSRKGRRGPSGHDG